MRPCGMWWTPLFHDGRGFHPGGFPITPRARGDRERLTASWIRKAVTGSAGSFLPSLLPGLRRRPARTSTPQTSSRERKKRYCLEYGHGPPETGARLQKPGRDIGLSRRRWSEISAESVSRKGFFAVLSPGENPVPFYTSMAETRIESPLGKDPSLSCRRTVSASRSSGQQLPTVAADAAHHETTPP